MLKDSVAAYEHALLELTRDRAPSQWATIQNNLSSAWLSIGQTERRRRGVQEGAGNRGGRALGADPGARAGRMGR